MMRKKRFFGITVFAVIAALVAAACSSPTGSTPDPDPGTDPVISITAQPTADNTFTVGGISGSLSVTAAVTEGAALSYQWYSNTTASNVGGVKVNGATGTSFNIPANLAVGDYYYFCEITASGGAAPKRSSVATVTVIKAGTPFITITGQPKANTKVTEGAISGSLSVTATVTEGASPAYQWYKNTIANSDGGEKVTGATAANFTIPADLAAGDYYYFCELTAPGAASVRSSVATVTVAAAGAPSIKITVQPAVNTTATVNDIKGSLSVTADGINGAAITGYQWYENSTNSNEGGTQVLPASMDPNFTIPAYLGVGEYYYFCEITASAGAETIKARSNVAKVTVSYVITITAQPEENTPVKAGDISGSLSVTATVSVGAAITGYQWYRNDTASNEGGNPIGDATADTFTIPANLAPGVYYYFCEVAASGGTVPVRSGVAKVTVSNPDTNVVIIPGGDPELVALSAEAAAGTDTPFSAESGWETYQWYVDGITEPDATAEDFTFNRPAGRYNLTVKVTDAEGGTWSGSCWVTVTEGEGE